MAAVRKRWYHKPERLEVIEKFSTFPSPSSPAATHLLTPRLQDELGRMAQYHLAAKNDTLVDTKFFISPSPSSLLIFPQLASDSGVSQAGKGVYRNCNSFYKKDSRMCIGISLFILDIKFLQYIPCVLLFLAT